MKKYVIALDVGQVQDPCAIQVWRATQVQANAQDPLDERIRYLLKDDLIMQYKIMDTKYKTICKFAHDLMEREDMHEQSVLVFDATGVGRALKETFQEMGVKSMVPVVYTAGGKVNYVYRDMDDRRFNTANGQFLNFHVLDEVHVPKADMVDAARIALEHNEVRVAPNLPYAKDFELQLRNFTGQMRPNGYVAYNNADENVHDDLVNCFMIRSWYRANFRERFDSAGADADTPEEMADIGIYGG